MDVTASRHQRPVDWSDKGVISEFGSNLEALAGLVERTPDSLSVSVDLPVSMVKAYFYATAKDVKSDHLQCFAGEFLIQNMDELATSFETEKARTAYWKDHLRRKNLLPKSDDKSDVKLYTPPDDTFNTGLSDNGVDEVDSDDNGVEDTVSDSSTRGDLYLLELVWEDDFMVSLGTQTFDLKDKLTRWDVVSHISAAKGDLTFKSLLEKSGLTKPTSWLSGVKNGKSRINRTEIEAIAAICKTPVGVLLTGFGLDLSILKASGRSMPTGGFGGIITVPKIAANQWTEFFKGRIKTPNIKLAEGVSPQDLMEVVLKLEDEVDWPTAFLNLTEGGAKVKTMIDRIVESVSKTGDPIKVLVLMSVVNRLWPDDESE